MIGVLLLLGCFGQSYEAGLRALCDAPLDPRVEQGGLLALSEVIEETVRNREVHALAERLAAPESQAIVDQIRKDAAEAGISRCALLEPVVAPGPIPLP